MTRILRDIVGGREPTFSSRIQSLEDLTGKRTIDIELTAEMLGRLSDITKQLNLDPLDTTPEELYASLLLKAKEHDKLLRESYHNNLDDLIRKINNHPGSSQVPVIKHSALRSAVAKVPPKKVMSLLGYRAVSSMLKRADIEQVILGAFIHESVTWHRAFVKEIKKCKISDMTLERPKVVLLDSKLTSSLKGHHIFPYAQLAALVGVSGLLANKTCGWLELSARAGDGLFHLHQRGVYLKLNRFEPNIIKRIIDLSYISSISVTKISSVRVPWTSVYSYISRNIDEIDFDEETNVDKNDFKWNGPIELLKDIHHQLNFWKMTTITAKPTDSKPVSLNLSDIAFNALHEVSYDRRTYSNIARLTLEELLSRYFSHINERDSTLRTIGL